MGFFKRYKTIALGLLALVTLMVSAVYSFDIDPKELFGFLLYSLLGLVIILLPAAILAGILQLRRKP